MTQSSKDLPGAAAQCSIVSISKTTEQLSGEEEGEKRSGLREERFTDNNYIPLLRPFATYASVLLSFATDVETHFGMQEEIPDVALPDLVEKAARGIIHEGSSLVRQQDHDAAESMAQQLRNVKNGTRDDIWKVCVKLYTMSNFLHKKLNEIMRIDLNSQHESAAHAHTKIPTFGPFVLLLQKLAPSFPELETIVYRGVTLSDNFIAQFNEEATRDVRERLIFQAFTSTTRNRQAAEAFAGNTLFEVDIGCLGIDIAQYSQFPDEQEVLLMPGFWCRIETCEYDEILLKWIIRLLSFL